jgi:hypothetical protein
MGRPATKRRAKEVRRHYQTLPNVGDMAAYFFDLAQRVRVGFTKGNRHVAADHRHWIEKAHGYAVMRRLP